MLSCEGKVNSCNQNVEFYQIYPDSFGRDLKPGPKESEYLVTAYFFSTNRPFVHMKPVTDWLIERHLPHESKRECTVSKMSRLVWTELDRDLVMILLFINEIITDNKQANNR